VLARDRHQGTGHHRPRQRAKCFLPTAPVTVSSKPTGNVPRPGPDGRHRCCANTQLGLDRVESHQVEIRRNGRSH
jgi:hypothetical protein